MRTTLARSAAWGLALLIGATASAQTGNSGNSSDEKQGSSAKQGNSGQNSGKTDTVRGEVAGVSVVGETMVDSETGRGVVAELTYLTILGSPSDERQRGQKESAQGGGDSSKSDASKGADRSQGNRSGDERSSAGRRNVYLIAVGPDTQVCRKDDTSGKGSGDDKDKHAADRSDSKGQKDSANNQGGTGSGARQQSLAALASLELGDRVEVEFTRLGGDQGRSGSGNQGNSASQARHGRNRVVRGVARTIEIIPDSGKGDSGSGKGDSGSGKGKSSSTGNQGSGSDSGGSQSKQDK